jgi:hypothetical protein
MTALAAIVLGYLDSAETVCKRRPEKGQKRNFPSARIASALAPITDIGPRAQHVRKVPKSEVRVAMAYGIFFYLNPNSVFLEH